MNGDNLTEEKILSLSSEECFDQLIDMIKNMSREELIEFMRIVEVYKALHKQNKTALMRQHQSG